MSESNQVSVKELASKLKVSDALLKKFIKDFSINTIQEKKLTYVSHESAEILKEIIRLRDAGKKNIEIKKLFEESQKAQAQEEAQAVASPAPVAEAVVAVEAEIAPVVVAETTEAIAPEIKAPKVSVPEIAEEYYNEYLTEQISETSNEEVISLAMQQAEGGSHDEPETSPVSTVNKYEAREERDEERHEREEKEDREERDERDEHGNKRRRRQFSFRFIQRQIANDMSRVDYIRHKLKRGKLSTLEKLHLEDSLDKRSHLLSGWTHLLRWVKN